MLEKMNNNINVFEEKNIKNTLLYVKNVGINEESYETKMLIEENIENVLKFQIVYEGEEKALVFDVSNTISLEEFLKSNKLKKKDICKILDSIDNVLSTIENYLIEENSLAMDLRLIRVEKKNKDNFLLKFIVIPNYKSDFSYELSKFLIKILRFIDIDDKNALTLAYGLFVRSSKENYTINDLMELVDKVRDTNKNVLKDVDIEALNAYDEENAIEMPDTMENEIDQSLLFENVQQAQVDNNNLEPIIDRNTKDLLSEEFFEKFDDEPKNKVVKMKKKLFDFKPKKVLSGHINLMACRNLIIPAVCVLVPIIFYLMYGLEKFLKFAPYICLYDIVLLILFVINNIMDTNDT